MGYSWIAYRIDCRKKLNIKKEDIGKKISIKNYNEKCKNFVNKNLKKWKNLFNKLGFFIDKKIITLHIVLNIWKVYGGY